MSTKSKPQYERVTRVEFIVDAALFDMDGTLVDSIGAVETAWGNKAEELGMDRQQVIDQTHGRRAIDNLRDLQPELRGLTDEEMEPHVRRFEETILEAADSFKKTVRSRRESVASSRRSSQRASRRASRAESQSGTPGDGSRPISRQGSMSNPQGGSRKNSFASELSRRIGGMSMSSMTPASQQPGNPQEAVRTGTADVEEDPFGEDSDSDEEDIDIDAIQVDTSDLIDNSVIILPGVRRLISEIPDGLWCVATSSAETYCFGALERVGIKLPPVVVTADSKELKRGKPFPDPFILAANKMGHKARNCVVFEDSPSGIKAGIASGAKVIAVSTSHPVEKIRGLGTYLVPNLSHVKIEPYEGKLKIIVDENSLADDGQPKKERAFVETNVAREPTSDDEN